MRRLKCDVSHDDADSGAGTHPLEGGQEGARPANRRGLGHDDQCAVLIDRRENG
jgi:hypothetical protein